MDHETLVQFYKTIAKAYRNWPGGDPGEQEMLHQLRNTLWQTLLESQFKD